MKSFVHHTLQVVVKLFYSKSFCMKLCKIYYLIKSFCLLPDRWNRTEEQRWQFFFKIFQVITWFFLMVGLLFNTANLLYLSEVWRFWTFDSLVYFLIFAHFYVLEFGVVSVFIKLVHISIMDSGCGILLLCWRPHWW